MLAVRIGLFFAVTNAEDRVSALTAYFVAYSCMLHWLRFGDALQHTYDSICADPKTGKRIASEADADAGGLSKREIEHANTFSPIFVPGHTCE